MQSREYIKRIWRVPKHRGATEYLATLMVKALVKHGWPAKWEHFGDDTFRVFHHQTDDLPPDMYEAVRICARIVARTYRVDISQSFGRVTLNRHYEIRHGFFREVK